MATCGANGSCYVKNDAPVPFSGKVHYESFEFATGKSKMKGDVPLSLPVSAVCSMLSIAVSRIILSQSLMPSDVVVGQAGAGVKKLFTIGEVDGTSEILMVTVTDESGKVISSNPVPYAAPKDMKLPKTEVTAQVASTANSDGSVNVDVTSDGFALYVTLTTLAQGYFSYNAFVMTGKSTVRVTFIPVEGFDVADLKSLRVEHAATYM